MVLIVVGCALIAFGFAFAIWNRGSETAGLQVFKVNVSGASWLIIVLVGVAAIGAGWWFDSTHVNHSKEPASDVPLTVVEEAVFEDEFPDEPYTFGDDGDLDQLWLGCEAGAMQACDDLYQQSPIESEYEMFGATCGHIFDLDEAPALCVEAPTEEP